MKNEPIRILQVFGRLDRGGAEGVIMNLYRKMDRSKIQFDFVVHTNEKCAYDDEILEMGGCIYHVPQFKGMNILTYIKSWNSFFIEHTEYQIIHSHLSSSAVFYLLLAKTKGITSIIHSHNTSSGKGFQSLVKDILQYPLRFICDYYMACSFEAGKWLFGKRIVSSSEFFILKNAINMNDFYFNKNKRRQIRNELKISGDKKIIISVGRFHYQKNHNFLIDVFNSITQKDSNCILLLVGDGELREELKYKVKRSNLEDKVYFCGIREDIPDLLSASDLFLFPSHFEGLGLVLVEAQASSLPCLISDTIPDEVIVTESIEALSLSDSMDIWSNKAIDIISENYERKPIMNNELNEYDINKTSKWLSKFYLDNSIERKCK